MKHDLTRFLPLSLPLSPATLHILLALAGQDMHGYGIMQEVSRQSEGLYKLGPGTLYDNLQRLTAQGWVREISSPARDEDSRRRYYRLTAMGRKILAAEVTRLEGVIREAKLCTQTVKPRRA